MSITKSWGAWLLSIPLFLSVAAFPGPSIEEPIYMGPLSGKNESLAIMKDDGPPRSGPGEAWIGTVGVGSGVIVLGEEAVIIPVFRGSARVEPSREQIREEWQEIGAAVPDGTKKVYILSLHGHYDHAAGIPLLRKALLARNIAVEVLGNDATAEALAPTPAEVVVTKIQPLAGPPAASPGEQQQAWSSAQKAGLKLGGITLRLVQSCHANHFGVRGTNGINILPGDQDYPQAPTECPTTKRGWRPGSTMAALISSTIDGRDYTIYVNDAAGDAPCGIFPQAILDLAGPIDAALVTAADAHLTEGYPTNLLSGLQPDRVIVFHYWDFVMGLDRPLPPGALGEDGLKRFTAYSKAAVPSADVLAPLPRPSAWIDLTLPPPSRRYKYP